MHVYVYVGEALIMTGVSKGMSMERWMGQPRTNAYIYNPSSPESGFVNEITNTNKNTMDK